MHGGLPFGLLAFHGVDDLVGCGKRLFGFLLLCLFHAQRVVDYVVDHVLDGVRLLFAGVVVTVLRRAALEAEGVGDQFLRLVEGLVDGFEVLLQAAGFLLHLLRVRLHGVLEGVVDFVFELLVGRFRRGPELPDCPPDRAPHLGQLLRAEDKEAEEEYDDELRTANT